MLSLTQGLSSREAEQRLAQFGPNAVIEPHVSPFVRIARRFWEPVPWMLEALIVLQLAIGERVEALIIAALLIFNVALGVFQEGRANAALAALKSKLSLKAFVERDGQWIETPAAGLVQAHSMLVPELSAARLAAGNRRGQACPFLPGSWLNYSRFTSRSTQTQKEAMGHLNKYYPIPERLSGVSNQGRTRHHDTPLARGNKPVQQRNADDGFLAFRSGGCPKRWRNKHRKSSCESYQLPVSAHDLFSSTKHFALVAIARP